MKIGLRTGQNPSNFSHFEGKFASKSAQSPSKSRFLGNPPDLQNRALMNKGGFLKRDGTDWFDRIMEKLPAEFVSWTMKRPTELETI